MSTVFDALTRKHTAFNSFQEFLDTSPGYRPTILQDEPEKVALADAFDTAMAAMGQSRRAWRGSRSHYSSPIQRVEVTFERRSRQYVKLSVPEDMPRDEVMQHAMNLLRDGFWGNTGEDEEVSVVGIQVLE